MRTKLKLETGKEIRGDNDEYYDDIVSNLIRGWNIKYGRLVIEY